MTMQILIVCGGLFYRAATKANSRSPLSRATESIEVNQRLRETDKTSSRLNQATDRRSSELSKFPLASTEEIE